MLIKDLKDCEEFEAGDKVSLREILHPDKADLDIHYCLAHAVVNAGKASVRHILKISEVYYILEGEGIMYIDDESAPVHAGQAIYIPPNAEQYIENTGATDLKFLCITDPAWKPEDEEVL
ncbi:cupin domain-containing protein [Patescibacteria group bacterium]